MDSEQEWWWMVRWSCCFSARTVGKFPGKPSGRFCWKVPFEVGASRGKVPVQWRFQVGFTCNAEAFGKRKVPDKVRRRFRIYLIWSPTYGGEGNWWWSSTFDKTLKLEVEKANRAAWMGVALRVQADFLRSYYIWSNYSDLTRPHSKWWFSKGNPLISGKSRLVKYYNLAWLYSILLKKSVSASTFLVGFWRRFGTWSEVCLELRMAEVSCFFLFGLREALSSKC